MLAVSGSCAVLGLACGALLLEAPAGAATNEACVAPQVSVELPPGAQWQTATEALAQHLHGLRDLDKCARVSVRPEGTGVVLKIVTSDGREATRQVADLADLLRTTEALLVLPPQPTPMATKMSPLEVPPVEPQPAKTLASSMQVELGAAGSLRIGGGPLFGGGGVAGFAQFALDRWLLAVSGRWDIADAFFNQPTPSDFHMEASSVGVSVGRRFDYGGASLDALLGPNVVLESQDADDGDREIHGAAADFRLAVGLRVSGPRSSSVRAFAAGDFESSPARLRSRRYLDRALPQLPWWSSGLAVGVLWGAR
jgi:hypothetical protein